MTTFQEELRQLGACHEASEWVGERTREQAWADCERVDWLLWYAVRVGATRQQVVTCACRFARLALQHTEDTRVLACIETTESWVRGEATLDDVRAAGSAAWSAAYAADYAAYAVAWSATDSAAYAAYAARSDAYAAYDAAYAAWSSAADSAADSAAYADYAAWSAAWFATRRQCCDVVRDVILLPKTGRDDGEG